MTGALATIPSGDAIERARAAGLIRGQDEERRWRRKIAKANVYAAGTMVPAAMRGKPDVVLAGMLLCNRLGFSEDSVSALYAWEQDGRVIVDPPAQMYHGAAANHGWATMWGHVDRCWMHTHDGPHEYTYDGLAPGVEPDPRAVPGSCGAVRVRPVQPTDEVAELLIRPRCLDDEAWESFAFTIRQARQAGLLDQWVEKWVKDTGSKSGWKIEERCFLGRPDIEVPDWAKAQIRQGRVKGKDNWQKWPADMLASKASKRAVRLKCPEVLFGMSEEMAAASGGALVLDEADTVDAEIVPVSGGHETGAVERQDTRPVAPAPVSTSEASKRQLLKVIGVLDDDHKIRLRAAVKAAAIPPLHGALVTVDHVAMVLALIDQTEGSGQKEGPGPEDAGGSVEDPPAPTYAKDEEPPE